MAAEPELLDKLLGPYGLVVFLLVGVVWGGIKGAWVFGWTHKLLLEAERRRAEAAEAREAEWKLYALRALNASQEAAETARTAIQEAKP